MTVRVLPGECDHRRRPRVGRSDELVVLHWARLRGDPDVRKILGDGRSVVRERGLVLIPERGREPRRIPRLRKEALSLLRIKWEGDVCFVVGGNRREERSGRRRPQSFDNLDDLRFVDRHCDGLPETRTSVNGFMVDGSDSHWQSSCAPSW